MDCKNIGYESCKDRSVLDTVKAVIYASSPVFSIQSEFKKRNYMVITNDKCEQADIWLMQQKILRFPETHTISNLKPLSDRLSHIRMLSFTLSENDQIDFKPLNKAKSLEILEISGVDNRGYKNIESIQSLKRLKIISLYSLQPIESNVIESFKDFCSNVRFFVLNSKAMRTDLFTGFGPNTHFRFDRALNEIISKNANGSDQVMCMDCD